MDSHVVHEVDALVDGVRLETVADTDIRQESLWAEFNQSVTFGDFSEEEAAVLFYENRSRVAQGTGSVALDGFARLPQTA
jgi:hypothetical protein